MDKVSALFVDSRGVYPQLVSDCWDEKRDARLYAGSNPVVAHPPCERWGRLWWSARHKGLGKGDDGGCFASAIETLRRVGGVLEHPEASHAFDRFDIHRPRTGHRWTRSLLRPDEWVTSIDQLPYGHRARKRSWLVVVGVGPEFLPALQWEHDMKPSAWVTSGRGGYTPTERGAHRVELMGKVERKRTPRPFAELLIAIASMVG